MTSFRHPGTVLTDHTFGVPLDYGRPDGEQIEIFAREVVAADKAGQAGTLPWLLFLQGGPGNRSPRPIGRDVWLDRALREFRVLLLDQRGTGRSTPANRLSLARLGHPQAQADYLALFRADNIVRDAERIRARAGRRAVERARAELRRLLHGDLPVPGARGNQREAFITGGLPGLDVTADDVYRVAYPRVTAKVSQHYERYPDDVDRARHIARHLARHDVRLPAGMPLTVENFQALGHMLGMSTGSHELHYLLEDALTGDEVSDEFLYQAERHLSYAGSPLYALLHEACYAPGCRHRLVGAAGPGRVPGVRPGGGGRTATTRSCSPAR